MKVNAMMNASRSLIPLFAKADRKHILYQWLYGDKAAAASQHPQARIAGGTPASFDLVAPDLIRGYEVCVVDRDPSRIYEHMVSIAKEAAFIDLYSDFNTVAARCMKTPVSKVLIVVNIESFDSITDAVDSLLFWKPLLSHAVFVICSVNFSSNDFTKHRIRIADASLRLPCSEAGLALAVESAMKNKLETV